MIRIEFTVRIGREAAEADEPEQRETAVDALVERAEPTPSWPVGFAPREDRA